jgi:hypothetical protein
MSNYCGLVHPNLDGRVVPLYNLKREQHLPAPSGMIWSTKYHKVLMVLLGIAFYALRSVAVRLEMSSILRKKLPNNTDL